MTATFDHAAKLAQMHQHRLIAFVNSHGGIFATPTSDGGVWIYIPYYDRNTDRNDVDRYKARTFGEARAHLGY